MKETSFVMFVVPQTACSFVLSFAFFYMLNLSFSHIINPEVSIYEQEMKCTQKWIF